MIRTISTYSGLEVSSPYINPHKEQMAKRPYVCNVFKTGTESLESVLDVQNGIIC